MSETTTPIRRRRRAKKRTIRKTMLTPPPTLVESATPVDRRADDPESHIKLAETPPAPRLFLPLVPYFNTSWKYCADAFASNVSCVIAMRLRKGQQSIQYWQSAIKTLKACSEGENEKRRSKGQPEIMVKIIGNLTPYGGEHLDEQRKRYRLALGITEFWLDEDVTEQALTTDHYGDEFTPIPPRQAKEGVGRIGYATNKTWRDELPKLRGTSSFGLLTDDTTFGRPPVWWRDYLKAFLTK